MGLKVLLIYPNLKGMNMLPPAIGLLSTVLKDSGFTVKLFDTTYYEKLDNEDSEADSDRMKVDKLMARPYTMPHEVVVRKTNVYDDFKKLVEDFRPDLLAVSATEDMFLLGIKLLRTVRHLNILTIAGGVFATFAPKLALSYPEIDIVCKGEGEYALKTLSERLAKGQSYDDVSNLWIKRRDGTIQINTQ